MCSSDLEPIGNEHAAVDGVLPATRDDARVIDRGEECVERRLWVLRGRNAEVVGRPLEGTKEGFEPGAGGHAGRLTGVGGGRVRRRRRVEDVWVRQADFRKRVRASAEGRGRVPVDEEETPEELAPGRGCLCSAGGFPEASGECAGPRCREVARADPGAGDKIEAEVRPREGRVGRRWDRHEPRAARAGWAACGRLRAVADVSETTRLLEAVLAAAPPERLFPGRPAIPVEGSPQLPDADRPRRSVALCARVALSLWEAHQEWASDISDMEDDQAIDAVGRLSAIADFASGLSASDPVGALLGMAAGRALATWFVAIEVALARTPADEPLATDAVSALLDGFAEELGDVSPHARAIARSFDPAASACSEGAQWIADAVREALPELGDRSRDALAEEVTRTAVYNLLFQRVLADGERSHRAERRAEEAARVEAEGLAAERIEAERLEAEAARIEAERIEAGRLEAERLAAEAARIEAERLEAERLAAERLAAEEARIEAERLEAARVEAERLAAEAARIEAERLEAERLAAEEAARVEAERLAAEEAARIEAERLKAERLAAEEAARIEAERLEGERLEAERLEIGRAHV